MNRTKTQPTNQRPSSVMNRYNSSVMNQNNNSVTLIPGFSDNYFFFIQRQSLNLVVDPGDATPILEFCKKMNLAIGHVLLTHHHPDHIGGVSAILKNFPEAQVWAPAKHLAELKALMQECSTSQKWHWVESLTKMELGNLEIEILDLPGHTKGHIAYYLKSESELFLGDVLFGFGCGRVFDGTIEEHFESLQKIKRLPENTKIYCAHEYTTANIAFTERLLNAPEFSNSEAVQFLKMSLLTFEERCREVKSLRNQNQPTVPLELKKELRLNLFLLATQFEDFKNLRSARNMFKI